MPFRCCVLKWRGNYDDGPKVSGFGFPKDTNLKQEWIAAIHGQDLQPADNSKVCELHFQSGDILRVMECYNEKTGNKLSVDLAIPKIRDNATPSMPPSMPLLSQHQEQSDKHVVLMIDEIHLKSYLDFRDGSILGASFNCELAATPAYVFMIQSIAYRYKDAVHILPVKKLWRKFFQESSRNFSLMSLILKHCEKTFNLEFGNLIKYADTLTEKALFPTSLERQNVKLVLQIFNSALAEELEIPGTNYSLRYTDAFEDRFGRYRQVAGSRYHISIVQLHESEMKLRIQSFLLPVLNSSEHGRLPVSPIEKVDFDDSLTENDSTCIFRDKIPVREKDLASLKDSLPCLAYVAGYCAHSVLKKLSCSHCRDSLLIDRGLEVEGNLVLIKSLDRGGLKYPSNITLIVVCYDYVIISKLLCSDNEGDIFKLGNQRKAACSILLEVVNNRAEQRMISVTGTQIYSKGSSWGTDLAVRVGGLPAVTSRDCETAFISRECCANTHAARLAAPTRKACSVSVVTLCCAN
ncbi:hypothetical protein PR048_004273 [Dryococelus australis]|uniref:THAP-type domain-containing protein n=1 Tax=Dryococelus australis TaxID=614101 RepID=A0ABQ9I512_9NEOP|nr:hypothetical protein PR048_004273 [Dryococelus australis]